MNFLDTLDEYRPDQSRCLHVGEDMDDVGGRVVEAVGESPSRDLGVASHSAEHVDLQLDDDGLEGVEEDAPGVHTDVAGSLGLEHGLDLGTLLRIAIRLDLPVQKVAVFVKVHCYDVECKEENIRINEDVGIDTSLRAKRAHGWYF